MEMLVSENWANVLYDTARAQLKKPEERTLKLGLVARVIGQFRSFTDGTEAIGFL